MLFNKQDNIIKYSENLELPEMPFCKNANIIYINGKGLLSESHEIIFDSCGSIHKSISHITLDGVPLVSLNIPRCPTCTYSIVTGHGIEKTKIKELNTMSESVNNEFKDLNTLIKDILPILSLLKSGVYIIADTLCYPTNGHEFFWDVQNVFSDSCCEFGYKIVDDDFNFKIVSGQPTYIYPTQNADCYNEDRVNYYVDKFKKTNSPPRAITYYFSQFTSFLLDGHHKACAAAILGIPLHCIVIMPVSYNGQSKITSGGITLDANKISKKLFSRRILNVKHKNPFRTVKKSLKEDYKSVITNRDWEDKYINSARNYPSIDEYSMMLSLGTFNVSDKMVEECLENTYEEKNRRKLRSILLLFKFQKDTRLKKVLFDCAKTQEFCNLKLQAFKLLSEIKTDIEVEKFFIDYITYNNDYRSELHQIADDYLNACL